jgi:hypothetical protein
LKTTTPPALAEGIKLGQVRPKDLLLDTNDHQTPLLEDRTKKPWYDILRFWKSVKDRRQTTGLKVTRGKQSDSPEDIMPIDHKHVPQSVSAATQERGNDMLVEQREEITDAGAEDFRTPDDALVLLSGSVPETAKGKASDGLSSSEIAYALPVAALLMGEQVLGGPKAEQLDVGLGPSDASTEAATTGEGSDWAPFLDAQKATTSDVCQSDLRLIVGDMGMPGSVSPRTLEWHSSAITIKDSQGVEHSEKLMYDTGSLINLTTPKFVLAHTLKTRPLLPGDISRYNTPIGSVTPTHYVELEMKDPKHGVNNFELVQFVIVPALEGFGLLLGRRFMTKHRIILDPDQGGDMYPVIARDPGPGQLGTSILEETILT